MEFMCSPCALTAVSYLFPLMLSRMDWKKRQKKKFSQLTVHRCWSSHRAKLVEWKNSLDDSRRLLKLADFHAGRHIERSADFPFSSVTSVWLNSTEWWRLTTVPVKLRAAVTARCNSRNGNLSAWNKSRRREPIRPAETSANRRRYVRARTHSDEFRATRRAYVKRSEGPARSILAASRSLEVSPLLGAPPAALHATRWESEPLQRTLPPPLRSWPTAALRNRHIAVTGRMSHFDPPRSLLSTNTLTHSPYTILTPRKKKSLGKKHNPPLDTTHSPWSARGSASQTRTQTR